MPRSIPGAHNPRAGRPQLNLFPKSHPCRADPVLTEGPAGEERCERPGTAPTGADPALTTALSSGHRFLSTSYNKVSYFGEEKPIFMLRSGRSHRSSARDGHVRVPFRAAVLA